MERVLSLSGTFTFSSLAFSHGQQILQKSGNHHIILGAKTVT